MRSLPFEPLDPGVYRELVRRALAEDFGWGDVTTEAIVDRSQKARGIILAKSRCVLAGLDIASEVFRQLDPGVAVEARRADGDVCEPGTTVAEYRGDAAPLLTAERTALNFLQRLSGIATLTRQFVDAAGGRITVLDTRKTTPLLRALEKYAVRAGGGTNHRGGLDEGILIKDNHVRLAGGVQVSVERMRKANREMPTEVEVQSLDQVDEAIRAGCGHHPARQLRHQGRRGSGAPLPGHGEDRDFRRRDARQHPRAGCDRRGLRVDRGADAFGAGGGPQLRH